MQIKHWPTIAAFSFGTLCYSGSILAAGSIHGQVRDQSTGKPVPFASISVKNCNSIEAMNDGAFIIDCPAGSYSLTVNAENYQSFTFDSFYLSDNEFLKKDVMLTPLYAANTQQNYAPATAPQNYYNDKAQYNSQEQYDAYPSNDDYSANTQQPIAEEPSRTGTALGNLMAKMAGNRLDTHMQKRQQRKQPNPDNYAGGDYYSNDSYYANDYNNDGYYANDNSNAGYNTDGSNNNNYYETDNSEGYYDSGNSNYYETNTTTDNNDDYYSNDNNYNSNDYYSQNDNGSNTSNIPERGNSAPQPGLTAALPPNKASLNNKLPQPGTKKNTSVAQLESKVHTKKQQPKAVKNQGKYLNTGPIVITNKVSVHIIAGKKKSRFTLKGNGLSSVKEVKVINPDGRGDNNIRTYLDRKKSSDTFLNIILEARPGAKTGSGFYRLQLNTGSDKIILTPDRINIIVEERSAKAPGFKKPAAQGNNNRVLQLRK